jgi:thioredoxin reductase (NADPH)
LSNIQDTDVLVIGSGPAGNTAAIYAVRSGLKTSLVTGLFIGGQLTITTDVSNFPGFPEPIKGFELMERTIQQTKNLGVDIVEDQVIEVDFKNRPFICKTEQERVYKAKNVIIAAGAKARWLNLPSEEKFKGYGVSGCAICDGNFFKNQDVMIIGGGDTAGTEALYLANLANKVYLVHRRDSFRMEQVLEQEVKNNKKIEIIYNSVVQEILGTEMPKSVTSVKLKDNQNGKISEIKVSGIFIAIGHIPDTDIFKNSGLKLDRDGYIITEPDSALTNIEGVLACGDVTNKPHKQAVIAAGYGCIAALEIKNN